MPPSVSSARMDFNSEDVLHLDGMVPAGFTAFTASRGRVASMPQLVWRAKTDLKFLLLKHARQRNLVPQITPPLLSCRRLHLAQIRSGKWSKRQAAWRARSRVPLGLGGDSMDFGTGVREIVGIDFTKQHRAFDSLSLGQLRSFSFGELKEGSTDAAGLRVKVAPPPVLHEFPRALHGFVIDRAGVDLRHGGRDSATFPRKWGQRLCRCCPIASQWRANPRRLLASGERPSD